MTARDCIALAGACALASAASAQVIDGTRDASYGSALSVQTIETGFGDNASEWNAAYGNISGGRLNLMFTGNLEANFNKLEIFIDSTAGGSNVLDAAGNDGSDIMDGMTFDTGFTPEYHLIARRGNAGIDKFDLDFSELGTTNFDSFFSVFGTNLEGSGNTGPGSLTSGIDVGYNGSNVAGIGGTAGAAADQAAALAVTTGFEMSIDLADLNYSGGPIRVMLLQNNDNHDFLSNQTLGGLPEGFNNLGSPASTMDFSSFAGDQFFTVPAPAGIAALGLGGLVAARRRR